MQSRCGIQCCNVIPGTDVAARQGPYIPKGPRHTQNCTRSEFTICNEFTTRSDSLLKMGDGKSTTKKLCGKDLAELSGELSGAICLKTLVLLVTTSNPLELFR